MLSTQLDVLCDADDCQKHHQGVRRKSVVSVAVRADGTINLDHNIGWEEGWILKASGRVVCPDCDARSQTRTGESK
jgi:hypothetical protein